MEELEKNLNENEISSQDDLADANEQEQAKADMTVSEGTAQAQSEANAEAVSESAEQTNAETEVSAESATAAESAPAPVVAEPIRQLRENTERKPPVYRWNYEAQKNFMNSDTKKKRKSGAMIYAIVVTGVFVVAFALLAFLLILNGLGIGNFADSPLGNDSSERVVYVREHDPASGVLTTQEIYNKCLPAVVTVSVSSETASGVGSGFIISEDGYIVTANHVVEGMKSVTVIMSNGDKFPADVIDGNEFTDLALLKVATRGLPTIAIGKSSNLLVGDRVVAIGTPASIDFEGSLSEGIVSYNDRVFKIYDDNGSVEKKMTLIQTSALVNPGNSGCPLINEYGEAVGIITMKLNSSYYEGMCFAIPTDSAMPIINAMKNGENYDALLSAVSKYPAKLGITVNNADPGVKIVEFASSSYDISRKMQVGDVIVSVDSATVTSISDLSQILDRYDPGDTVSIVFLRNSQRMRVDVVLG